MRFFSLPQYNFLHEFLHTRTHSLHIYPILVVLLLLHSNGIVATAKANKGNVFFSTLVTSPFKLWPAPHRSHNSSPFPERCLILWLTLVYFLCVTSLFVSVLFSCICHNAVNVGISHVQHQQQNGLYYGKIYSTDDNVRWGGGARKPQCRFCRHGQRHFGSWQSLWIIYIRLFKVAKTATLE